MMEVIIEWTDFHIQLKENFSHIFIHQGEKYKKYTTFTRLTFATGGRDVAELYHY